MDDQLRTYYWIKNAEKDFEVTAINLWARQLWPDRTKSLQLRYGNIATARYSLQHSRLEFGEGVEELKTPRTRRFVIASAIVLLRILGTEVAGRSLLPTPISSAPKRTLKRVVQANGKAQDRTQNIM
jgi:hypothetical protein